MDVIVVHRPTENGFEFVGVYKNLAVLFEYLEREKVVYGYHFHRTELIED